MHDSSRILAILAALGILGIAALPPGAAAGFCSPGMSREDAQRSKHRR